MQSNSSSGDGVSGRLRLWAVAIVLIYVAFAVATIATKRPWVDEGWFTGPGLDLVTRGKFGTLLLDPAGSNLRLFKPDAVLQGINEHTYWVMPLYLLQTALWGKLFGFSVFSIRIPSLLWGLVAMWSLTVIIRRLYPPGGISAALIGASVLAVDFGFVECSSDGRMDMMCSALGFAALAVYLMWREEHFSRAVLIAHILAAAACFTHPYGLMAPAALLAAMVWLDWKATVRVSTVVIMAGPYLLGAIAWALYCAQAPADFSAQFSANAASKMEQGLALWNGIWLEIRYRYWVHYWPDGAFGKLKIIGLALALGALFTLVVRRDLRQSAGCRLLLILVALRFLMLAVIGGPKFDFYLVHILPLFAAMIGIAAWWLWSSRNPTLRVLCAVALVLYGGVQTAILLHKVESIRGYQTEYQPLISYLKSNMRPDDLVAGSAELGFGLGFYNPHLIDDVWLGYWSHKQPTVVVVDQWLYEQVISTAILKHLPAPDYFATQFNSQFELVKEIPGYKVYRRRQP
jgi:hypothetical protein